MSVMSFRRNGEAGFSLIEVLAALFVFTLLTLGLVPLLTTSIRGSHTARADTIGKNAALKAMERVRGLPYYVSYATSTTRVDLLDLYYPNGTGDIVVGGRTIYRIVCPWNNLSNPACSRDVADGYTITFEAQFVDPVAGGTQPTPGETATSYANVAPAATYRWDSSTADTPPRQILQMAVTASWTVGGSDESYTITSLLSDRSFGGRKVKATASVGYGVDMYGAYDSRPGGATRFSSGNVFVLTGESEIEGRRLSTARQTTTVGRGELQQEAGGTLGSLVAATTSLFAPPDQNPGNITAPARTLVHPEFASPNTVAQFGPSVVTAPTALASSAAPSAIGDGAVTGAVSGNDYVRFSDPQLGNEDFNYLNLAARAPLVTVARNNGLPGPLPGITAPVYGVNDFVVGGTRASTLSDRVYSQATIGFDRIYVLDTNWPELSDTEAVAGGGTLTGLGHLIVIDDFRASVICDSRSDGTGSGVARFQATVYYWADPLLNFDRNDARYERITFDVTSTPGAQDPLAQIRATLAEIRTRNPLVYDHIQSGSRRYLFTTTGVTGRVGYLRNWNSLGTSSGLATSTDATGAAVTSVNATVAGAFEIESTDLDSDRRDISSFSISLGSLSCFAEDTR